MVTTFKNKLNDAGLEVLDQTDALLGYWDLNLICRFANSTYKEWFGKEPKEMIDRMKIDEVLGPLYKKNITHIEATLKGKIQVFEQDMLTISGIEKRIIATLRPDIENGVVKGFFVHVADISLLN